MAHDFEDLHDLDDLTDDELRDVVREHLREHGGIDVDSLTVRVEDGVVNLSGRLGTDGELRMAERVITDTLGIERFENELVVDALRREESPMAIDDHLAREEETSGRLLGDRPVPLSPEVEDVEENLDARLFGTTDVGKAIAEGTAWIPPQTPTPEGLDGTGTSAFETGEDH
jgi:hypothetical protein